MAFGVQAYFLIPATALAFVASAYFGIRKKLEVAVLLYVLSLVFATALVAGKRKICIPLDGEPQFCSLTKP